jgi:hypothetical protein
MSRTRKAGLFKILLIIVALAPIAFLIGQRVTGRDVLKKPQETNRQIQYSASPDMITGTH